MESLNDQSKTPINKRQRIINAKIQYFIITQRTEHPKLGKDKIKSLLDEYCFKENIKIISESTIGRIIKELKEKKLIPINIKLSLYGKTGELRAKQRKRKKKLRRKNYKPETEGDLMQLDTIVKFINGVKRYTITAIDIKSDFAFAYSYANPSSLNTKDFFDKLETIAPFRIKRIQTDNGSEFEKYFREHIEKKKIVHFYNYPRCPKMNAFIERFNRTIQEEFIDWHRHILAYDLNKFNHLLMDWLIWYNTKRPHWSLGLKSPLQYIVDKLTPEKSNMLWTDT